MPWLLLLLAREYWHPWILDWNWCPALYLNVVVPHVDRAEMQRWATWRSIFLHWLRSQTCCSQQATWLYSAIASHAIRYEISSKLPRYFGLHFFSIGFVSSQCQRDIIGHSIRRSVFTKACSVQVSTHPPPIPTHTQTSTIYCAR